MPKTMFTPPPTFIRIRTGKTCATCSTFSSSRSPILISMGAGVNPMRNEAPGGCTMISAPIPSTRLAVSLSMPVVIPTVSMTRPTSMATARMLMMVRVGRWSRFEMTILVSMRSLRPVPVGTWLRARQLTGANFDKLGVRGLLQLEFVRSDVRVEGGPLDGNGEAVIFGRARDLDLRGIWDAVEVVVSGVVHGFERRAVRPK